MSRNTDAPESQQLSQVLIGAVKKLARRQDAFSSVTSILPGSLALMFLFDLWFGHPHIDRDFVAGWVMFFAVLTIAPLIFGARYPRVGGLVMLLCLNYWTWVSASSTFHAHMEMNVLVQVPVLALYVGWFYASWIARTALFFNMAVVILAIFSRGWQSQHEFSTEKAVVYAFVISLLCLEIAAYLRREGERQSHIDFLTGVMNRRGLVAVSKKIIKKATRSGEPLTVAVIDFDDFKAVNDMGGHAAGDKALRDTAFTWVSALHANDVVARIGGDEFALIIHDSRSNAEKLLRQICESASYSWSWGLAELRPRSTLDTMLSEADAAMYQAKALRG